MIATAREKWYQDHGVNNPDVFTTALLNGWRSGKRILWTFCLIWGLVQKNLMSALKSLLGSSVALL